MENTKVGVIGLGYVGLPLAIEFGKILDTIGFDIDVKRIEELNNGFDKTLEVDSDELQAVKHISYTSDKAALSSCNVFIVTVPTPVDKHKRPDLTPLKKASEMLSGLIKKGDIVIYESTVYPGATEEECVPVLEQGSGLEFNKDFFAGYSPERINPGDKTHRLPNILKITSGSTPEVAEIIDNLYAKIITAGTYKASCIKVAEAAKVIENTQRDVNIALINELAIIFNHVGIDTLEVLEAAGTKWNFLPFRPGLVGGHCIGVDPYYLTHKAQELGYHPEMVLAGRRLNDSMGNFVCSQLIKAMLEKDISVNGARVLVMGLTFKEDCPDLRNTKVTDIIKELAQYSVNVDVTDPMCNEAEAVKEYGINLCQPKPGIYDAIIVAVGHSQYKKMGIDVIKSYGKPSALIYDLKYLFKKSETDLRL